MSALPHFPRPFASYAMAGDTLDLTYDGFVFHARIERDDFNERPDQRQDGFWPSLDPKDAGYIGPKSKRTLERHMDRAKEVMRAWEAGEWEYVGVIVAVSRNGVLLTDHAASLWGIEMNYPGSDNAYLTEVAEELLPEALEVARSVMAKLCDDLMPA